MKTLLGILVGLVLLSLVSCVEPNVGYPNQTYIDSTGTLKKDTTNQPRNIEVEFSTIPLTVVVIDSCEYLYGPWGSGTVLSHKGNCKNHIYK